MIDLVFLKILPNVELVEESRDKKKLENIQLMRKEYILDNLRR